MGSSTETLAKNTATQKTEQNFKIANLTTSHALKHKLHKHIRIYNNKNGNIKAKKKKKWKRKEKEILEPIPQTQSFPSLRMFCEKLHL